MSEDQSLRACFLAAEALRKDLENVPSYTSETSQELVASAVGKYEQCLKIADRVSLFSPNELLEDVSSSDLQLVQEMIYTGRDLIERPDISLYPSILPN